MELQQFTMEILSQGGGVHARQEMQHFVTTLQYYIMFEVSPTIWTLDTRRFHSVPGLSCVETEPSTTYPKLSTPAGSRVLLDPAVS